MLDNCEIKGSEFLRRVKLIPKQNGLADRWSPERDFGSHGTRYLGGRFTVLKSLKKELAPSTGGHVQEAWDSKGGSVMFTASYPATFLPEGKGFHVRFPDLPEALTGGDDIEDTLAQAADCLAEAIAGRIARGDEIPRPSKPLRGQYVIGLPLFLAPRLGLYLAMRERRITNIELAKRLGVSETVIRRMLNPKHHTRPEKIQAALSILGKRILVKFEDAA